MNVLEFYLADKLIILSGSDTSPLEPFPLLIKSTNCIPLTTFPKTVYCRSKDGAGKVLLRSAPSGTGIIAGGPIRAACEVLGVKDIVGKSLGSSNHLLIRLFG